MSGAKVWIWSIGTVVVVTAAIIAFVLWDEARTSQRLSAETEAVGFTATPIEWWDAADQENEEGHTLTYAYTAGDRVFTRTLEQVTWYDPATTYKVCYNPEDPEDAKLYPAEHVCGS